MHILTLDHNDNRNEHPYIIKGSVKELEAPKEART